jgi:hypothetical protein
MKVHYEVHNSPLVAFTLRQMNPGNTFPLYVFKIHFNITLQFTPRYSKWSPPFRSPNITLYTFYTCTNTSVLMRMDITSCNARTHRQILWGFLFLDSPFTARILYVPCHVIIITYCFLTCYNAVFTVSTIFLNNKKLCILPKHCIYMFHKILTTNIDYYSEQQEPISLCNGDAVCVLTHSVP